LPQNRNGLAGFNRSKKLNIADQHVSQIQAIFILKISAVGYAAEEAHKASSEAHEKTKEASEHATK
jgi:hypothetical protein